MLIGWEGAAQSTLASLLKTAKEPGLVSHVEHPAKKNAPSVQKPRHMFVTALGKAFVTRLAAAMDALSA